MSINDVNLTKRLFLDKLTICGRQSHNDRDGRRRTTENAYPTMFPVDSTHASAPH